MIHAGEDCMAPTNVNPSSYTRDNQLTNTDKPNTQPVTDSTPPSECDPATAIDACGAPPPPQPHPRQRQRQQHKSNTTRFMQRNVCQDSNCVDASCSKLNQAAPGSTAPSEQADRPIPVPLDPPRSDAGDVLEAADVPEAAGWSKEFISKKRLEAASIKHQMTHYPKNPFCRHCRACIAKRRQCRRGPGGVRQSRRTEEIR